MIMWFHTTENWVTECDCFPHATVYDEALLDFHTWYRDLRMVPRINVGVGNCVCSTTLSMCQETAAKCEMAKLIKTVWHPLASHAWQNLSSRLAMNRWLISVIIPRVNPRYLIHVASCCLYGSDSFRSAKRVPFSFHVDRPILGMLARGTSWL
jgi:hypothetical protein